MSIIYVNNFMSTSVTHDVRQSSLLLLIDKIWGQSLPNRPTSTLSPPKPHPASKTPPFSSRAEPNLLDLFIPTIGIYLRAPCLRTFFLRFPRPAHHIPENIPPARTAQTGITYLSLQNVSGHMTAPTRTTLARKTTVLSIVAGKAASSDRLDTTPPPTAAAAKPSP